MTKSKKQDKEEAKSGNKETNNLTEKVNKALELAEANAKAIRELKE